MGELRFRHVEADPADPVTTWPYEALVAAIERGSVREWARVTAEIGREPWGEVARQVEDYLGYADAVAVTALLRRRIARARADAEAHERAEVSREVAALVRATGLTTGDAASRLGTSRTRLSTYRSGRVVPSAATMVRLRRLAARCANSASDPDG